MPVVSRGDKFVFAQVIKDVVDFLELPDDTAPDLSPDALKQRYDRILETAVRLVKQMPDEHLEKQLPDRPRSWRVLFHHVFQIPTAFLDMEETGETLMAGMGELHLEVLVDKSGEEHGTQEGQ